MCNSHVGLATTVSGSAVYRAFPSLPRDLTILPTVTTTHFPLTVSPVVLVRGASPLPRTTGEKQNKAQHTTTGGEVMAELGVVGNPRGTEQMSVWRTQKTSLLLTFTC